MTVFQGKKIGSLIVRFPVSRKGLTQWKVRCQGCLTETLLPVEALGQGACPACKRGKS